MSPGRRELGKIDRMRRPGRPWVRAPLLWFARDPQFLRWPLPTSAGPAASSAGYLGLSLCPYPRPACHLLHTGFNTAQRSLLLCVFCSGHVGNWASLPVLKRAKGGDGAVVCDTFVSLERLFLQQPPIRSGRACRL